MRHTRKTKNQKRLGGPSGLRQARSPPDDVGADGDDDLRDHRLHGPRAGYLVRYRLFRGRPGPGRGTDQPRKLVTPHIYEITLQLISGIAPHIIYGVTQRIIYGIVPQINEITPHMYEFAP